MSKRNQLKHQVERVLQLFPDARNSDVTLMIRLWERYYFERIIVSSDGKEKAVNLKSLYILPREDHIKRYRAKIQNEENKYLPTDPAVARQRRINEALWHNRMQEPAVVNPYKDD